MCHIIGFNFQVGSKTATGMSYRPTDITDYLEIFCAIWKHMSVTVIREINNNNSKSNNTIN